MNNKFKRYVNYFLGFFPQALPVGVTAFNTWSESLIDTYNLNAIMSKRDAQYTLAASIISGGGASAYKSNFTFYLILRAAAAKQIAGAKFQDIQSELRAEQQAAIAAAKQAEATATPVASVPPQN